MIVPPSAELGSTTLPKNRLEAAFRAAGDLAARLVVPRWFFFVFLGLCTASAVFSQRAFALQIWPPHTPALNFVYRWFDPYLLFLGSAFYVFYKLGRMAVPSRPGRRRRSLVAVAATLSLSGMFFAGLYVIEVEVLKPVFSISRPVFWIERSVVRDLLTGAVDDQGLVRSLRPADFRQPLSRIVVEAVRNDTLVHVDPDVVQAALVAAGVSPGAARRQVAEAIAGHGVPGRIPSFDSRVRLLGQMTAWLAQGIKPFVIEWLGLENDDEDKRDAMPSGHILRQIVVLFIGLFMVLQRTEIRRRAFKGRFEEAIFASVVSLCFPLVAFSRFYGFQHSLPDMMMAAGFPVFLLPLLVFTVYWSVARRAEQDKAAHERVGQSVPDLLYQTDADGNLTYINQGFATMFGYHSEEEMREAESVVVAGVTVLPISNFWMYPKHRTLLLTEVQARKGRVLDYFCYVRSKRRRPFYLSVDSVSVGSGIGGTGREVTSKVMVFDGFYQTNRDGVITFCDEKFAHRFGYSMDELVGQHIGDKLYLDPARWAMTLQVLRDGPNEFATRVIPTRTKDGLVIAVEFANHLILQGGAFCGIEGTIRSVRTQGVYVIQDSRFVSVDEEFCRIFGYSDTEIRNLPTYLAIVAPHDRDMVRKEVDRKMSGMPGRAYEFDALRKGGQVLRVICDSDHGFYEGRPAVIGYILEAKPGRTVLERLRRRELFSAIGEAANDLTHWLGQVAPAISSSVMFIRQDLAKLGISLSPGEEPGESLKMIEDNARLIARMKRDLMGNADQVSEHEENELNQLRLAGIIAQALNSIRIPANVAVQVDVPSDIPGVPRRGPHLVKVFGYLVRNAIDAMPQGGRVAITGRVMSDARTVVVSVEDTGTGIKPEHHDKLFKPFWTTKPSGTESGLGLGLWYCRTALESMNAEIDFESEVGRGTKFEITFFGLIRRESNG